MASITLDVEEFVQMASYVYGANWRNDLSEQLGIRRKLLVLVLGDDAPVSGLLSESLCDLVEEKLARTDQQIAALRQRVSCFVGKSGASESIRRQDRSHAPALDAA